MSKITKTELMTFKTDDLGIQLQGTLYQGKPVFFAVKVAEALGYEKPHDALTKHCKSLIKIKYHEMESLGFEPKSNGMSFLSEADLFRLILKSKLPSAERVQDWVCEDVLPALRQHGSYSIKKHHKDEGSGLPEFRKAKAIEIQAKAIQIQMENVKKIFEWATNLSDNARQTIIAGLINPIAGSEVIPLPLITEKHYTATEIGKMFGVSANKIGRIANDNKMKVKAYGDTYLDKSPYSNKEVESFRYNENAIKKFREILVAEQESAKSELV